MSITNLRENEGGKMHAVKVRKLSSGWLWGCIWPWWGWL